MPPAGASSPTAWGPTQWGASSIAYVVKTSAGGLATPTEMHDLAVSSQINRKTTKGGGHAHADDADHKPHAPHALLGQWRATSIAGNDLLSSCLYTAGICAGYAGKMAPLSLLLVSVMLYFFRFVYGEVVTALALNGGSYTALANTTSKRVAALAACLSIISYVATAVVSALSAVNYVQQLWPDAIGSHFAELTGTVLILFVFAVLNLMGMAESANVATAMFITHFIALTTLMLWSLVWAWQNHWEIFNDNLSSPYPSNASWPIALYYGYAAAMLGITGFETAANYVEEMKDGKTYVRVLRNMWYSVAFFNPVLGLLAMAVLPMSEMIRPDYASNLLGPVAKVVGGEGFQFFICIDGFIVLCGSVLTAYVGIGGLLKRLALDRCLPDVLLATNSWRGTHHWIIISFFAISSSLFIALDGDVDMLGSVYNIAFLSVMTAFATSCIVLKWKRPMLPRMVVSSGFTVTAALVLVIAGLIGNIVRDAVVLEWFLLYFGAAVIVVFVMFNRTVLLKTALTVAASALTCGKARKAAKYQEKLLVESHARREREAHEHLEARLLAEAAAAAAAEAGGGGGASGDTTTGFKDGVIGVDLLHPMGSPSSIPSTTAAISNSLNNSNGAGKSQTFATTTTTTITTTTSKKNQKNKGTANEHLLDEDEYDSEKVHRGEAYITPNMLGNSDEDENDASSSGGIDSHSCRGRLIKAITLQLEKVNARPYVFFIKTPDFETMNKAVLYVRANEQTSRLIMVHVVDDTEAVATLAANGMPRLLPQTSTSSSSSNSNSNNHNNNSKNPFADPDAVEAALEAGLPPLPLQARLIRDQVALLDTVYPKLRMDFLAVRGTVFGPPVIAWLGKHLGIGTNSMFIAMPDATFPHQFASLGGVRVITRASAPEQRAEREGRILQLLQQAAKEWKEDDGDK